MLKGRKIVVVIPAGRREYLSILLPYLEDQRGIIDELRLWVNTQDAADRLVLQHIAETYPGWVTLEYLPDEEPSLLGVKRVILIRHFFRNCCEPNTVYVRLDDDICWMHREALSRLIHFRIDHPEYFLVYPAIINNGRTAYLHQVMGHLPERLSPDKVWPGAFRDEFNLIRQPPEVGETIHRAFLHMLGEGRVTDLMFGRYVITNYEKVAINCISWLGEEFAAFGGIVGDADTTLQEEEWLTTIKAKELEKPSCIWGQSLMAHFAFHTQREHLEGVGLRSYYKFLSLDTDEASYSTLP